MRTTGSCGEIGKHIEFKIQILLVQIQLRAFYQMIQLRSIVKTIDNSGARYIRCIKTLNGFNRVYAYGGDFILGSIRELRLIRKVKVGEIHLGLVVRTRKEIVFKDGSLSKFKNNSIIVLNKKKRVLGTRLFGWVTRKIRQKKFLRFIIMCGHSLI